MNLLVRTLALTVGIPLILAALTLLFGRRVRGTGPASLLAPAAALAVAYLAGHLATFGLPDWPPRESTQWIFFLAIAGLLLGWLQAWQPALRYSGMLFVSLGVPIVLLRSPMQHLWTATQSVAVIFGLGAVIGGLWLSMRTHSTTIAGGTLPAQWMLISSGTALMMQFSGSASFAQLSGALAAACGVLAVECFLRPGLETRSAVPVLLTLWGSLWICAWYYIETPSTAIASLAAATLVPWIPVPRRADGQPTSVGSILLLVLTLIFVGTALFIARPDVTSAGGAPY